MIKWLQLSRGCIRMICLKLHNVDTFIKEEYLHICEFFDKVLLIDDKSEARMNIIIKAMYNKFKDNHKSRLELSWKEVKIDE